MEDILGIFGSVLSGAGIPSGALTIPSVPVPTPSTQIPGSSSPPATQKPASTTPDFDNPCHYDIPIGPLWNLGPLFANIFGCPCKNESPFEHFGLFFFLAIVILIGLVGLILPDDTEQLAEIAGAIAA